MYKAEGFIEETLYETLITPRKHGTKSYHKYLKKLEGWIADLGYPYERDIHNNIWLWVGDAMVSDTMFACHTDSIEIGKETYNKKIYINEKGIIKSVGNRTLGADDGAGVYLLLSMIKKGINGLYCFFASEEVGCVGSKAWVEEHQADILPLITVAIQFDRRGTADVVTDMLYGDTASDNFGTALSKLLGDAYKPAVGTMTDVAEVADDVAECVNISVGYYNEHTSQEELDYGYLMKLKAKLLSDNFIKGLNNLCIIRDPNAPRKYDSYGYSYYDDLYDWKDYNSTESKIRFVEENADIVVEYLDKYNITIDEILNNY